MRWGIDLDGVVWLADQPIAGAAEAVARLRERGDEVVFVTNNSSATVGQQEAKRRRGIRGDYLAGGGGGGQGR